MSEKTKKIKKRQGVTHFLKKSSLLHDCFLFSNTTLSKYFVSLRGEVSPRPWSTLVAGINNHTSPMVNQLKKWCTHSWNTKISLHGLSSLLMGPVLLLISFGPIVKHVWNDATWVLHNFFRFVINTTAYHLGRYRLASSQFVTPTLIQWHHSLMWHLVIEIFRPRDL